MKEYSIDDFFRFEKEYNMFSYVDKYGTNIWDLVRYEVYDNLTSPESCNRSQYSKITISDISREILRKYQINISIEKVREFVLNIEDVFYSDILEKVYIDKEDYYKEIYNG